MAILVRGTTICRICAHPIEVGQDAVSFPPIASNERDPLYQFNDCSLHLQCLLRDPLGRKAEERFQEFQRRTGPGNRFCAACQGEILDPDDYFAVGHLTDDPQHPLNAFNYVQLHKSCIPNWPGAASLRALLQELGRTGAWQGKSLEYLIRSLGG